MVFTSQDRKVLLAIADKLSVVIALEVVGLATEEEQMANVDALRREVEELTTVVSGAEAAINGLKQQVADALAGAGVDQATIDEITAQIDAQTNKLALAIAANTEAGDEAHAGGM